MTGIDRDRQARRVRWATEQLGLSPDATPEEVRTAWLRRLPEDDFVPPSEARDALEALLGRRPDGGWQARADEAAFLAEEERLRGEVEGFAVQFWDLPADKRRQVWQGLMDRCATVPVLRIRLLRLERGIDTAPLWLGLEEDEFLVELAGHVREQFVLRPEPRARARQEFLRQIGDDRKEWRKAVRRLRRRNPALAALSAELLNAVLSGDGLAGRIPRKPPVWALGIIVGVALGILRIFIADIEPPTRPVLPPASPALRGWDGDMHKELPPEVSKFQEKYKLRVEQDKDGKIHLRGMEISEKLKLDKEPEKPALGADKRAKGSHE